MTSPASLSGVFPVLPTPFDAAGQADEKALRGLVRYLLEAGVDGITYPGVASEVGQLSVAERLSLTAAVLDEVAGRVPVVAGVSSAQAATTIELAKAAIGQGAVGLMVAVPPDRPSAAQQIDYFREVAAAVPSAVIVLQNVPMPVGAGLDPEAIVEVAQAVPSIRYVKEETLPSGQRLTVLREHGPATLAGVFGGAGGRYITDELRRGAAGTMPAIELAEVHVALFKAHRAGDEARVRELFTRMLPILNVQAVFRWSLTKYVLSARGLLSSENQRAAGPRLDALDKADVDAFLADVQDLLLPAHPLRRNAR
ncbi:dihydrodipicolinate synthase family protein [Hydrogenophaga sp. BPS33]|uniref:dihydrodipicolinate synthase family protein n=1 Tax=Hydrogenophaga sp. BPS33 TaxID=2651974 RepID=UPI00131F9D1A|nr:dihydrodipicolinate synthase family protein [Hydrogenophaga sp. BPS33]QHE86914.1 dihydrodipicolinate synthase family protein [Hydrogenophaga sp. BPS33]